MRLACLIILLLASSSAFAGPAVVPLLAGVGAAGAAVAAGAAAAVIFQAFAVNFAVTFLLQGFARKLQKTDQPNGADLRRGAQTITARASAAPRQIVLGRTRVGGVITYLETTNNNEFLHMVITMTGHEIESFDQIWFDDDVLTLDASGNAQGQYFLQDTADQSYEATVPGSPFQVTVPHAINTLHGVYLKGAAQIGRDVPWYPRIKLTDVSPAAAASQYQFSRSGSVFTFHSSLAAQTVFIDHNYVTGNTALARVLTRTGAASEGTFSELVAESAGKWTPNHLQKGCAKIYVRLRRSAITKVPTGIGNVTVDKLVQRFEAGLPNITAVIKGVKAYDPRSGLTAYTRNPALLLAWYLTLPKASGGVGVTYATGIDEAALIAAANICDEDVALAAGGTEKRYTCDGAFNLSQKPGDVVKDILSSMSGNLVKIGVTWKIYAGAYITPTVTLDESECRGNMRIQSRVSRRELFNGIKGVFRSEANNWQPSDFPPVTNATYLAEDGEALNADIELPFTSSAATAQRLGKIELERARQQITVDYPGKLSVFRVQPPEVVFLDNTRMGWSSKPFEVVRGAFSIYDDANGAPALGYDLTLRETASTVFDWNSGEETTVDPAPDTNLPGPFDVPVPGLPSVTESLYATSNSVGVRSRVTLRASVDAPTFVTGFQFEYRPVSVSTWTVVPLSRDGEVQLDDLLPGYYNFRARCLGAVGNQGAYSEVLTQQILGLTAPPEDITGFAVSVVGGQAMVSLNKHPDLDVLIGGRIVLRWSPLTSGATWNDGSLLSQDGWPGDSVFIMAPMPGSGTVLAKARDSSGNYSLNEVSFVVTEALLTGFVTAFTLTEHPAFAGSKTNVAAVDGGIQLVGDTLIDDMGLIDSQDMIDSLGGIVSSGSYAFATKGDLGSVQTVRVFPHVKSLAFDTNDTWDSRTDPIDSWGLVDGGVIEDCDARLMVRVTNDDPNGTPTWGDWQPLPGPADFTCRGFDFRLDYANGNVTHNRSVTELSVAAKTAA